jgi:hypothetical protein
MIKMTKKGILQTIKNAYNSQKAARVFNKAIAAAVLANPAQAALDIFTGTQTVATAQAVDVELMVGDKGKSIDTKVMGSLGNDFGYFGRTTISEDSDGNVKDFALADLSYNIGAGFSVLGEAQAATFMGVVPRVGASYFGKFGDVSVLGITTVNVDNVKDISLVANLHYATGLTEDLTLHLNAENVSNLYDGENAISFQKLRAGVEIKGFELGLAADLTEVGKEVDLSTNIGGYLKKDF